MTQAAPFSSLDPACILDALQSIDLHGDGRLLALNSYENRVYQIGMEEGAPLIAKFYRPNRWSDEAILEEHAFLQELSEAEIPVVSPLSIAGRTLHAFSGHRFAVFTRHGGRAPELDQPGVREWIGRFIGRIHALGAARPFRERPTLDIDTFGRQTSEFLLAHDFIPPDLEAAYRSVVTQALEGVQRCYDRAGQVALIRLHGDCHMGNLLWTDDGPHFVDFDDCRMGPAIQDLWMLLSGDRQEMAGQFADVLAGYEDFCEFNPAETWLIEALRTLRLLHYSAWLAQRWHDPAFPLAFPWFNTQHYWQNSILELREQIALMNETPIGQGNL
ncbi:MAG TPA: serine/threonine protein kinase [Methylophilaceae bacterium]|nr:serine/threonine protein kinase [Methylophilaceae bacterium]